VLTPYPIQPSFCEKIWGSPALEPWFPRAAAKIGEVWFDHRLPILVKFIFTTERLSVQVHPGGDSGKTEMWYVLRAEPGAALALGFREPISRETMREAALSGEIVNLLRWYPAKPGETYFVPAGTVHAIGAGLAICEIQQNSDVTYRLYDYGRPRELHLEKGLEVASGERHPGPSAPDGARLAFCPYFATESLRLNWRLEYVPDPARFHLLIVLEGEGAIGGKAFHGGEAWMIPAGAPPFLIEPAGEAHLLRTYVP
jgi:mannose-6-phosphate isomerase